MPDKWAGICVKTETHDVGIVIATGAYLACNGIVSDASLIDMRVTQGKHPAHGKTVCGESLGVMWKPSDLYLAHRIASMVSVTAWASECRADRDSARIGRPLRSVRRSWSACIVLAACRYEGKP